MAMPRLNISKQRGFTLIEALFSAIVLGIGLLALAGFHAVALQDGTAIKMRMAATNLAQEKLDDLKSFSRLFDDATVDENADGNLTNDCGAATFCYSEIDANAGGQEDGTGNLIMDSGSVTISATVYNRSWAVSCFSESASNPLSVVNCADPDGDPATDDIPAAKLVTVTIAWNDTKGVSQSTVLQGVIYGLDPAKVGGLAQSATSGTGPKVSYTPVGVPDAVPVPINTGGTKFKESSKPLPEVSQSGTGIEVSFDSVIYTGTTGDFDRETREEFSTVGCECQFVSGTNTGYTPARKIWNGTELVTKVGEAVAKVTGQTLGNNPPNNCDICCRDHHDLDDDDYPKYDPQRPDDDYTSGDHKHYWYSSCVTAGVGATNCTDNNKNTSLSSGTPLTAVTSGAYLESCRVMRVAGFWRVMQDWQLRKVTILPYDFLLTDANLTNYVNLVEEVVEDAVKQDYSGTGITIGALGGRDLSLSSGAAPVQLLSRAVYVDTIYGAEDDSSTADNELTLPDSAYYTALLAKIADSQAATPANSAWLESASFYEANLTLLYDWLSSDTGIATITSEPIEAIVDPVNGYYGSFSRGKVTIQSGSTAGSSTITAKARLANSGVTGGVNRTGASYVAGYSFGTDYYDSASTLTDTITVSRLASGTAHSITGKVVKGNSSVNVAETGSPASPLSVTANTTSGTLISACTPQTGDVDTNAWYYTCTVSDGWTGTLTFGSTSSVYTLNDATTTSLVTSSLTVSGAYSASDVIAYGGQVTIKGYVYKDNYPSGNPSPNITVANTSIGFSGTSEGVTTNGTCTDKVLEGSGANEKLRYSCVVPKGWSGAITVQVDATGGSYTYLSTGNTPCTGSTTGSCTMLSITSALADIDGTSASATTTQQQQTNVTARR
jgi:type II secretory pathway pseudopilin PulG